MLSKVFGAGFFGKKYHQRHKDKNRNRKADIHCCENIEARNEFNHRHKNHFREVLAWGKYFPKKVVPIE